MIVRRQNGGAVWQMTNAHQTELKRLAVLYSLGLADAQAKDAWTLVELEANSNQGPDLHELFVDNENTVDRILALARSRLAFEPVSLEGVEIAKTILRNELTRFLNREISPIVLCALVNRIELQYLGAIPISTVNESYYPRWIGDLYNNCDCCDDTWTLDSSPHLAREALAVLQKLEAT
jgi:hypothetical protein